MQKSRGWMAGWRVTNQVDDNGADARQVLVDLQVRTQSPVAMALCALTGKPTRLSLRIEAAPGERKSDAVETELAVKIVPGWKSTKTEVVLFTVYCAYSGMIVRDLDRLTTAQPLTVGLDLVQEDLDLDPVTSAMQSFVRGMGASGGGSITVGATTVEIPDDPGARFLMGEEGSDGDAHASIESQVLAGEMVPLEDLSDDELEEIGLTVGETAAWHAANENGAELVGQDKAAHGRAVKKLKAAGYAV